jgi:hypothetical protein
MEYADRQEKEADIAVIAAKAWKKSPGLPLTTVDRKAKTIAVSAIIGAA